MKIAEDEIIFDFSLLLGRIRTVYGTNENFAKDLHISLSSLSKKLNNRREFTSKEIVRSCKLLGLESAQEYFFKQKVQESEQK